MRAYKQECLAISASMVGSGQIGVYHVLFHVDCIEYILGTMRCVTQPGCQLVL